jgi:hypothetical protein
MVFESGWLVTLVDYIHLEHSLRDHSMYQNYEKAQYYTHHKGIYIRYMNETFDGIPLR